MINQAAIDLIKKYEGLHDGDLSVIGLQPKLCPAGIWTIGYGHALKTPDGTRFLRRGDDKDEAYRQAGALTEHDAEVLLVNDLVAFERGVKGFVLVPLTENQLGALVSLAYNIGLVALKNSTLLQRLNNSDCQGAADSFPMWNKAKVGGVRKELKGLTARRLAERELFLKAN